MSMRLSDKQDIIKKEPASDRILFWIDGEYVRCGITLYNVDYYYWKLVSSYMYDKQGNYTILTVAVDSNGIERNYPFLITETSFILKDGYAHISCERKMENEVVEERIFDEYYSHDFVFTFLEKSGLIAGIKIVI